MISNDSSDSKKKLEQTGRADSLDLKAIESLYGNKPKTSKDMEYKKNIIEVAHPDSKVVAPSYDKLNGLVENENERQNINLHIVQKMPDGLLTKRKYAEQQLLLSLVRVGNDLDNRNQDQLRALADTCLEQVSTRSSLKKKAQFDPVTLSIGATVAVLGGIYLKQHMRFISDGMEKDHDKLIAEIDDLLNASVTLGVGYQYKPEFLDMLRKFRQKIEDHYAVYQKLSPMLDSMQKPRDADELRELQNKPETAKMIAAYNAFYESTKKIMPMITAVQKNFSNEMYKQRQIEDSGFLSSLVDKTQILHGGYGLVADDFDDVNHALQTYVIDITNVSKAFAGVENYKQKLQQDLESSVAQTNTFTGGPKKEDVGPPPEVPGLLPNKPSASGEDEISKGLKDLGIG